MEQKTIFVKLSSFTQKNESHTGLKELRTIPLIFFSHCMGYI